MSVSDDGEEEITTRTGLRRRRGRQGAKRSTTQRERSERGPEERRTRSRSTDDETYASRRNA